MNESKTTTKIPGYCTLHWAKKGEPTGSWWLSPDMPRVEDLPEGFFAMFHPAQEVETTMMPCVVERTRGFVSKPMKIDLEKFLPLGSRLNWRQRIFGVA